MKLKMAMLGITVTAFALFAQNPPAVGFTLNGLDGKQVSLSDFSGKVVVIDFWATWCQACKEAFPKLNDLLNDFGPQGVNVIGINIEHMKPERVQAFVENAGIDYKVLLDPKAETVKTFGIKGVPSLVVIAPDGTVQQIFRGINNQTEKEVRALLTKLTQKK
jgi:cytochrome c biogenesis protein CcmG, thiol:disulfide interchange protein DsbE